MATGHPEARIWLLQANSVKQMDRQWLRVVTGGSRAASGALRLPSSPAPPAHRSSSLEGVLEALHRVVCVQVTGPAVQPWRAVTCLVSLPCTKRLHWTVPTRARCALFVPTAGSQPSLKTPCVPAPRSHRVALPLPSTGRAAPGPGPAPRLGGRDSMPWSLGLPHLLPRNCLYCKQLKLGVLPGYPSVTETKRTDLRATLSC